MPSVGQLRNGTVASVFRASGHPVTVVTSRYASLYGQAAHVPVARYAAVLDYRAFSVKSTSFHPSNASRRPPGYTLFRRLRQSFPTNLILGEGGSLYIADSIRRVGSAIAAAGGTGLLYTSYGPLADIYIGLVLKKLFPRIIWWSDWRDAPIEARPPNYFSRSWERRILRRVLRQADVVSAVSRGVADQLPTAGRDVHVVYNGVVDRCDRPRPPRGQLPRDYVSYTGSLYARLSEPGPALNAIALLNASAGTSRLHIVYCGKDGGDFRKACEEAGLADIYHDLGVLPSEEVAYVQRKAVANLLLTYAYEEYRGDVSMKVFEYLASGRPILCVHTGPADDEVARIVHSGEAPRLMQGDSYASVPEAVKWLRALRRAPQTGAGPGGFLLADNVRAFRQDVILPLARSRFG